MTLYSLREIELYSGNFDPALDFGLKIQKIDSTIAPWYHLAFNYLYLKNYTKAYQCVLELENELKKSGNKQGANLWIGYIYLKNNRIKEADFHFDGGIKLYLKQIESNHLNAQRFYSQFLLACIYAVRGENEKAMENLKLLKKRKTYSLSQVTWLKYFPLLDNIRQEPEFADILKDVEAR